MVPPTFPTMKSFNFIFLFYLLGTNLYAQDYQAKIYNYQLLPETISDTYVTEDDRIFALCLRFCEDDTECSAVMELDNAMNVLWYRTIHWLDTWSKCLVVHNDTIAIAGNDRVNNEHFWVYQLNTNGDSLNVLKINPPADRQLTRMFCVNLTHYNNKYVLGGQASDENEVMHGCIFSATKSGRLDTLIMFRNIPDSVSQSVNGIICKEIEVDQNNLLTASFMLFSKVNTRRYTIISKFDVNFMLISQFESRDFRFNPLTGPEFTFLNNRNIVFALPDIDDETTTSLQCIDKNNKVIWEYSWPHYPYWRESYISQITTSKNGDILICGNLRDSQANIPREVYSIAYVARLSPQGKLLWEHAYSTQDQLESNYLSIAAFSDICELENGDLIVSGELYNKYINIATGLHKRYSDLFIVHTDANGCMDPFYCDDVNLIEVDISSDVTDIKDTDVLNFNTYPNPASTHITLTLDASTDYSYTITNTSGQTILSGELAHDQTIDISSCTAGLYLIKAQDQQGKVAVGKFIVVD
jgi:hypothetical protein